MSQLPTLSLLNDLQSDLSKVFGSRWLSSELDKMDLSNAATSEWAPAVDIKEEKNQFRILADIPGVDPKAIEVHMEKGILTISGEKSTSSEERDESHVKRERFVGKFYRRFSLPDTADGEQIKARSKHGVLEVTIPKIQKSVARKIEVDDQG